MLGNVELRHAQVEFCWRLNRARQALCQMSYVLILRTNFKLKVQPPDLISQRLAEASQAEQDLDDGMPPGTWLAAKMSSSGLLST